MQIVTEWCPVLTQWNTPRSKTRSSHAPFHINCCSTPWLMHYSLFAHSVRSTPIITGKLRGGIISLLSPSNTVGTQKLFSLSSFNEYLPLTIVCLSLKSWAETAWKAVTRQTTGIITQNQTNISTFYMTTRAISMQSSCIEYRASVLETQNLQHSNWQGE